MMVSTSYLEIYHQVHEMASIHLLVGYFFFIHATVISGYPTWTVSTFSDLVGPAMVNELHAEEWGQHTLRYIPCEISTSPV